MVKNRYRREKKADRLLNPGASKEEIACDFALAPLDDMARSMDRKWGVDRLPELVDVALAKRYGVAVATLNEAIQARDPERVAERASNCIRGLRKLDETAEELGAAKADPNIIEYEHEGFRFGIMLDQRMWPAQPKFDFPVFTLGEIAGALKRRGADHPLIEEVKTTFPGSEVTTWNREKTDPDMPLFAKPQDLEDVIDF